VEWSGGHLSQISPISPPIVDSYGVLFKILIGMDEEERFLYGPLLKIGKSYL